MEIGLPTIPSCAQIGQVREFEVDDLLRGYHVFEMLKRYLRERYRHFRLRREKILRPLSMPVVRPGLLKDWPVCPSLLSERPVVYSFGVGANVAWDLGMIEQLGADVFAFDPTPESIAWVAGQKLPAPFHFYEYGIAARDGVLNFYPPKKPGRIHYSQDRQKYHRPDQKTVAGKVYRLSSIGRQLGHTRIDVLKLDVEGTEFDCVPDLLTSGIDIGQLLVEVHYHYPRRTMTEGLELLRQIEGAGFRCFDISPRSLEFAFANVRWLAPQENPVSR